MSEIFDLWQVHKAARWPTFSDPNQGELMTLDTVISGCVTYYLDAAEGLDPQRIVILEDCLADLNRLMPDLAGEAAAYFERTQTLACLLLATPTR
ncbi:MAG: hypothetical protein ACKOCD_04215 [Nitrospiraceae bacterium]